MPRKTLRVETVSAVPARYGRTSKYNAHYAAALAGKVVVLPAGAGQPGPRIKKLGLSTAFRDGRYYIFKQRNRTSRARRSKQAK